MLSYKGKTALITGASSGIGEAFAYILAVGGMNLVLVVRSTEKLRALAQALSEQHGIRADVGPEGSRQLIGMMLTAFPDMHVTVEDMIAEGNKVVVRFTERGTQQGAFGSIPPTGKQVAVSTIDIVRIEGGKISEEWGIDDMLGMLQQLGLVPAMG